MTKSYKIKTIIKKKKKQAHEELHLLQISKMTGTRPCKVKKSGTAITINDMLLDHSKNTHGTHKETVSVLIVSISY